MSHPRLKALADAIDPDVTTIDDFCATHADFEARLREASTLIRSLSDVEPVAWIIHGSGTWKDAVVLQRETAESRLKDRRDGSEISPLYTHPAPETFFGLPVKLDPSMPPDTFKIVNPTEPSGSVPQAPAEGIMAIVGDAIRLEYLQDPQNEEDRAYNRGVADAKEAAILALRALAADELARSNVSRKEPEEQRGGQDEKTGSGDPDAFEDDNYGFPPSAVRHVFPDDKNPRCTLCGRTREDHTGVRHGFKTGEAPK